MVHQDAASRLFCPHLSGQTFDERLNPLEACKTSVHTLCRMSGETHSAFPHARGSIQMIQGGTRHSSALPGTLCMWNLAPVICLFPATKNGHLFRLWAILHP